MAKPVVIQAHPASAEISNELMEVLAKRRAQRLERARAVLDARVQKAMEERKREKLKRRARYIAWRLKRACG